MQNKKRYIQLIVGFIVLLFVGVAYAWSLFVEPLELEFGWKRDSTSLIFTISMICFSVGSILSGLLLNKYSHKMLLLISGITLAIGFIACANVTQLWHIFIAYGILCGFSTGVIYNVVIVTINTWFVDRIGFSSGVLLMGFGIGSLLLGSLISKTNATFGWRKTFYILAVLFGVILLIAAVIISSANGSTEYAEETRLSCQIQDINMLKQGSFYAYYIWAMFGAAIGLGAIGNVSPIATSLGADTPQVILATGAISITNGLSRIVAGILYDRLKRRKTMMIVTAATVTGVILLNIALRTKSLVLVLVGFLITGAGYGGIATCNSAFVKNNYGTRNYARNFGIVCTFAIPASLLGSYLPGIIMTAVNSYSMTYSVFISFAVASIIAVILVSRLINKEQE